MKEKKCFKCGLIKPLNEFYKHPQMKDGTVNKCKECNKKDVREHRLNPEYRESVLKYDRDRFKSLQRKINILEYQRKRRKKYPEKESARRKLSYAIKYNNIVRQPCEVCGNKKVEAHHYDYSKPLDVRWLCFKCHRKEHGQYKN